MADVKRYFNRAFASPEKPAAADTERANLIVDSIPLDTRSVLDVGCGTGFVAGTIARRFPVSGMELTEAGVALTRSIGLTCHQASIDKIPCADRSVDLVVVSEVLEHLDDPTYAKARSELQRVADRYILVTVPNRDYFPYERRECPRCRSVAVPWGHIRLFDSNVLVGLFDSFELCEFREFGPRIVDRGALGARALNWPERLLRRPVIRGMSCPVCKYEEVERRPDTRPTVNSAIVRPVATLGYTLRFLAGRLSPKCPRWILALYRRDALDEVRRPAVMVPPVPSAAE